MSNRVVVVVGCHNSILATRLRDALAEKHTVVMAEEVADEEFQDLFICDDLEPDIRKLTREVLIREEDYSLYAKKPSKSKNKSERKELRGWR